MSMKKKVCQRLGLTTIIGLVLAGNLAGVEDASAELPYGHPDFMPTPQRPLGFRGDGTGVFPGGKGLVTDFNIATGRNIVWKVPLSNTDPCSAIMFDGKVFINSAPDTLGCFDAQTGRTLWETSCPYPASPKKMYRAIPTPASDGRMVVAKLGESLMACDLTGKVLWKRRIPHCGTANSSPVIVEDLVVLSTWWDDAWDDTDRNDGIPDDRAATGRLVAFDLTTGALRWKRPSGLSRAQGFKESGTPARMRLDGTWYVISAPGEVVRVRDGHVMVPFKNGLPYWTGGASIVTRGDEIHYPNIWYRLVADAVGTMKVVTVGPSKEFDQTIPVDLKYTGMLYSSMLVDGNIALTMWPNGDMTSVDRVREKVGYYHVGLDEYDYLKVPRFPPGVTRSHNVGLEEAYKAKAPWMLCPLDPKNKKKEQNYGWFFTSPAIADGLILVASRHGYMISLRRDSVEPLTLRRVGVSPMDLNDLGDVGCSPFIVGDRYYMKDTKCLYCIGKSGASSPQPAEPTPERK